jgi:hypothetical protein
MLYGHLEIRANCLIPKQCNKCCTTTLGKMRKFPKNNTAPSPQNLCQNNSRTDRTDCTFCFGFPALFFLLYGIRKSVQYGIFCWTVPSLNFCACSSCCATCSIHTVQPAFNAVLAASISVLVCCLGMHALALINGCSLAARKRSLSCSLKNESTTQEWVHPPTLIDLMRQVRGLLIQRLRLD